MKTALIILDGRGMSTHPEKSAISQAQLTHFPSLWNRYPHTTLHASGEYVGLPDGQMGNSEVGHMHIGAGRVLYQDLVKITKAITDGSLASHPLLHGKGKRIHLLGVISDGGVHGHIDHIIGMYNILSSQNDIFVHGFGDGRDVSPTSIRTYIDTLEQHGIHLSSVIGRYYAMDRNNKRDRIKKAYDLLVHGEGIETQNLVETIGISYDSGVYDEFLDAYKTAYFSSIQPGDTVIFTNFRSDRARQLTTALTKGAQDMKPIDITFIAMTPYEEGISHVLFPKDNVTLTLGEIVAASGLSQIRIAETEKYPHVTFFFSGGREEPFENEKRILCESPKVATYDLAPEMATTEIASSIIPHIRTRAADLIVLNFAAPDMVGHTGDMNAAIRAVQTVDTAVGEIVSACEQSGYTAIIIADHGNVDYMVNDDGSPNTAHSLALVPCIVTSLGCTLREGGSLVDIAPTIIDILGITQPHEMTGQTLLIKNNIDKE